MAAVSFTDDLIRDYLLYRGFMGALKALDVEIKVDKEKGFRPDRVVDHLCNCMSSLDMNGLLDAWHHLDQRIFSRLEHSFLSAANKLEVALLRMYIVTCISNSRHDKLVEFFERKTPELQNIPEWKDWFALPFLKSPEENPQFQVFFTRQWQDTMLMSLQNFLSVAFQSMSMPILLSYEDEIQHLTQLQEENEAFKQKLSLYGILENEKSEFKDFSPHTELMDDFCVIAQEAPAATESQSRSLRSLIRNIGSGLPTSPLLGRRQGTQNGSRKQTVLQADELAAGKPTSAVKPKPRVSSLSSSTGLQACGGPLSSSSTSVTVARIKPQMETEISARARAAIREDVRAERLVSAASSCGAMAQVPGSTNSNEINISDQQKGSLLLLSQEEYGEHHSCISHCKFNCTGTVVASSDTEGVIKIWSPIPSPQTVASIVSRSSVLSLEWANKRDKLLLHGNVSGQIRLYDVKDKRTIAEIGAESNSPLKDQRIMSIVCNPGDTHFVCSTSFGQSVNSSSSSFINAPARSIVRSVSEAANNYGKLLLWDLRTQQLDRHLPMDSSPTTCNCCAFNHNGQLLITGTADGKVSLYDMRTFNCIANWIGHLGETFSVQFSADETSCYTMGADGKFLQWSVNRTGQKMADISVHSGATGPFIIGGPATSVQQHQQRKHHPLGKMFAFDSEGKHVLTCGATGGILYKLSETFSASPTLALGGHRWPVVTVDWSTTVDCGTCLTGSVEGKIQVSTLLAQ